MEAIRHFTVFRHWVSPDGFMEVHIATILTFIAVMTEFTGQELVEITVHPETPTQAAQADITILE